MITMVDVLVDGSFFVQFPYKHVGTIIYDNLRIAAKESYPSLKYKDPCRWDVYPGARRIGGLNSKK